MTDPKPKRQRNSTELTIGEATRRMLVLRAELPAEYKKAEQEVFDRYVGKEAAILMRVAEEARGIVRQRVDKVSAAEPDQSPPAELDAEAPDEDIDTADQPRTEDPYVHVPDRLREPLPESRLAVGRKR